MSRTAAAVVLLLGLTGPAAAQPPAPPPPTRPQPATPGRPAARPDAPPPPGWPAPQPATIDRTFILPQDQPVPVLPPGVVFGHGGPQAPGAGAPRLVVAKVVDGALVWSSTEFGPVVRQVNIPAIENGAQVVRTTNVTTMQQQTKDTSVPLEGLKIRDLAGKRIQPLTLEIRLGKGGGVVLHSGPLPNEVKALLKPDTILVEMPSNPGMAGATFAFPAGGGAAPTPIFRTDLVAPTPAGPPGTPVPTATPRLRVAPPVPAPPPPAPPPP